MNKYILIYTSLTDWGELYLSKKRFKSREAAMKWWWQYNIAGKDALLIKIDSAGITRTEYL